MPDEKFYNKPLYVVLFSTNIDVEKEYSPIVTVPQSNDLGTMPHAMMRDMAAALPGLWYCLHLPNTFYEFDDIQVMSLKARQALHLNHTILPMPIQVFNKAMFPDWPSFTTPALTVCPDDIFEEATIKASLMGFPLPTVRYSQLSDESLKEHWRAIHAYFVGETPYLGREPHLTHRLDQASTDLPRRWLSRQMTDEPLAVVPSTESPTDMVRRAIYEQAVLGALAQMEYENTTIEEAKKNIPDAIEREMARLRVPVSLALPGVPPTYIREVYDQPARQGLTPIAMLDASDTWSIHISDRADHLIERAAIEFVATHQAISRSGVGLMLGELPRNAYTVLAQLERHFIDGPNGPTVFRLLDRLQRSANSFWSEATTLAIANASSIVAFSNFPIGLLRFPGDTSVLANHVPIAYRPLIPLTRTVQKELENIPSVDFTSDFHILVAECIPEHDPVGRYSRAGWKFVAQMIRDHNSGITIELRETLSIASLQNAIDERIPDILVISAHGHLAREGNTAGLLVGDEFYIGLGLNSLPPVVILSACHVTPRGAGAVSIADLMLREGAIAVLGTQVPVDVRRNSMLMMRFFLYMAEVLAGREKHANLLEVWHHVQMSNAINDILSGGAGILDWGSQIGPSGLPVMIEFMQLRSPGRLRWGHAYHDTETVLGEIADDQGIGNRVRNWFRSPGYVPESLFYLFTGRPERIYLRSPRDAAMGRFTSPDPSELPGCSP